MTSAIKTYLDTVSTFKESGGTVTWTPKNTSNGNGRISNQLDLGAPQDQLFRWCLETKFQTATVGNVIRLYIVRSSTSASTTYQDGAVGVSDANLTTEALLANSALPLGPLVIHSASGFNVWSGITTIINRYVNVALWNASGVALTNTAGDHEFRLEPVYNGVG